MQRTPSMSRSIQHPALAGGAAATRRDSNYYPQGGYYPVNVEQPTQYPTQYQQQYSDDSPQY
jgi:hypothetical protein